MTKYIFAFFFLVISIVSYAQPGTVPVEVFEGKKYYVHTVEQGNTLFGLQRTYGVPVESIIKSNPGVEKGLNVGQKVKIPVLLQNILHEVKKSETLFGIAKKYGVTVESILAENPEAKEGVKVGQKLSISGVEKGLYENMETVVVVEDIEPTRSIDTIKPQKELNISFSDTIIDHVVLDQETLYSISKRFMVPVEELQAINKLKNSKIKPGDTLRIPVRKESIELVKVREVPVKEMRIVDSTLLFPKKDTYKIAILLPFNLDKGGNDQLSLLATEFYMGAQLALDSLEKLGLKAQVYVHDTKNDSISLKKVLAKPEFKGMDLVIGPLMADNAGVVGRWCKENGVRMICPVSANTSMLLANPYIYHAVPSDITLMQGLASKVLKDHSSEQIILVKSTNDKDKINYDAFRNAFMSLPAKGTRPKLIEATLDNFTTFLKRGMTTVFIFPSNDKSQVLKFHNGLNIEVAKYSSTTVSVYGTKEWLNYEDIPLYNAAYIFGFASPNNFSYEDAVVKSLHRKYRDEYKSDMSKIAVQGFDVTFFFCAEMFTKRKVTSSVMNDFKMVQAGTGNGYENSNCYILRQENGVYVISE